MDYLHRLSITHGNLKRVCSFLHLHFDRELMSVQTNILIDARGRARVAGLGVAFLRSAMPGVDIDRFFHGAAPELVDPQRFGVTDTGATKASDAYAFGVLAWEVGLILECLVDELLNGADVFLRFSPAEPRFPMRVGLQGFTRC